MRRYLLSAFTVLLSLLVGSILPVVAQSTSLQGAVAPLAPYVSYPSASGIVWRQGTPYTITWTGFSGSYVKIELYKGSSLNRTIASSTANDGSESWTVPTSQPLGSDYRIKITSTSSTTQYDYSDNYFAIKQATLVVYVGAHPDDIDIGMSGSLYKHDRGINPILWIVVTDGGADKDEYAYDSDASRNWVA